MTYILLLISIALILYIIVLEKRNAKSIQRTARAVRLLVAEIREYRNENNPIEQKGAPRMDLRLENYDGSYIEDLEEKSKTDELYLAYILEREQEGIL